MTESTTPRPADPNRVLIPVGLMFIVLGTVFLFIDDMRVVGWTFIPAGIVFISIGIPARRSAATRSSGDGDAAVDGSSRGGDGGGGGGGGD